MASLREIILGKLNRNMQNIPTNLTNNQRETVRTRIGASDFSGSYNDLSDVPSDIGGFGTTEIRNSAVTVSTVDQWVSLGVDFPAASVAQWLLLQINGNNWIPIYLPDDIRSLSNGTVGSASVAAQRYTFYIGDVFNTLYLGKASDDDLLFTTGEGDNDSAAFSPTSLIIRRIDR